MGETNSKEIMRAIEIFKDRYGIREPLDMFRIDEIIEELRKESKLSKKGKKK
jgi:hypothetical protein